MECSPIDLTTILIIRLCLDAFVAVVFLTFVRRHPGVGGPGWWAFTALLSALGSLGVAMALSKPDPFPVALGFTAVTGVFAFGWLGLRSHMGLPIAVRGVLLGLLALALAQMALVAYSDSLAARRVLFAAAVVALAGLSLRDIRHFDPQNQRDELRPFRWLLLLEMGILGLLIARTLVFGASSDDRQVGSLAPFILLAFTVDMLARAAIATSLVSSRLKDEQDAASLALQASVRESRALVENLSAGVMVFRPDETLASVNAAARRFLGWPQDAGRKTYMESVPELRLLREDGQPLARSEIPLNRVLAERRAMQGMVLGVQTRHRPEVRWGLCNGYPQFDAQGQLQKVVLSFLDITSLKHAEAEQQALQAQLMQAQKMESLGTLAGGVAHDFNNILAAILGNADLARQDLGDDDPARESLHEISAAARRGRELVRQILAFSRQQPMARELVHLGAVLDESCRLLRTALTPQVELTCASGDGVPPVLADATQLGQVLLNLGTNAIHAMEGRPGRVAYRIDSVSRHDDRVPPEVARACHAAGVDAVCISVTDTGAGMTENTRKRIFEPFFTTKLVGQGTGLGLPVVLGIVQAHGGAIDVNSQPGEGTCFSLYFAAAGEVQRAAQKRGIASNAAGDGTMTSNGCADDSPAEATSVPDTRKDQAMSEDVPAVARHIMYLDDDDTLVFLVQRLLERRGYRVTSFTEQDKAIEAVRNDPDAFHLLLTDYNMPGMSGIEVARQVLALSPGLPVAVASGYITDELKNEAMAAGVCEVVFKTDAVEAFCEVVARLAR